MHYFIFSLLISQIFLIKIGSCTEKGYPYSTPKLPVPTQGVPWPMPKQISFGETNLTLNTKNLQIAYDSSCQLIIEAVQRYKNIISNETILKNRFTPLPNDEIEFKSLKIFVDNQSDCDQYPYLGMNENYQLIINESEIGILHAQNVWGVLRGLETFSQLIYLDHENRSFRIRTTLIDDQPRFEHRGLLLDTSRHYLSVQILLKNLDLMAMAKFNVFHWHLVDDQSFPYVSSLYSNLSKKGAYTFRHTYTPENISTIVEYARLRGIRVIPEFDTPGHMISWGRGQPDLLTACYSGGERIDDYGLIDPSNPNTFDFLSKFLKESAQRFPDQFIHLGGDEVFFDCWKNNINVQNMMKRLNISDETKLEEYYMHRLINLTKKAKSRDSKNSNYLVWQEIYDNGIRLDSDAIVQVWKGNYVLDRGWELYKITFHKLRAILSSCWYLSNIQFGENWEGYYKCDPHQFLGTPHQKSLVIGGEVCMWGEFIDNTNLLSTTWPRASVVAERLWSPSDVNDADKARPRLEEHRCRLVGRGFPASPVTGPGFCHVEYNE